MNKYLAIHSSVIETLPSIKILGIEFDSMLSFKDHITKQLQKIYAYSGALRRIRRFVLGNVMLRLYKTFILPHFVYYCPLFLGLGKVQANRLEDANYYILRSLLGYLKSTLYDELLRILNMETLDQRTKQQYLILTYIRTILRICFICLLLFNTLFCYINVCITTVPNISEIFVVLGKLCTI